MTTQVQTNAIAVRANDTGLAAIKDYFRSKEIMDRFAEVMGSHAGAYISSAVLAVANSEDLQKCTAVSIVSSALRAATLRLSCDPATKQAWLVPFYDKKSGTRKAQLLVGYKGYYDMAMRTGQYTNITVNRIYEGYVVDENPLTGLHSVTGRRSSDKVQGYLLYFRMRNGFEKTVYMTVEELLAHAEKHSKTWDQDKSLWHTEFDKMAQKTLLRLGLSRWGYFDPFDAMGLGTTEEGDNGLPELVRIERPKPKSEAEIMSELGFDVTQPADEPEQVVIDVPFELEEEPAQPSELELAKAVEVTRTGKGPVTLGSLSMDELKQVKAYLQKMDAAKGLTEKQIEQLKAVTLILAQDEKIYAEGI